MARSKIKIKPSKRGTFTKAAKSRGKGVQEFASTVLANKENYSPAMVKKANFARNASKWNHAYGGEIPEYGLGGDIFGGAASGAATGATIGGPWGAVGGAVIGGVAGLLGGNSKKKAAEQQKEMMRLNNVRQSRLASLEPNQNYASAFQYPHGGEVGYEDLVNKNLPIVQDPIENATYLRDVAKGKIKGFKVGGAKALEEGSKAYESIKNSYEYPYTNYAEITNSDGEVSYFPVLNSQQYKDITTERGLPAKDVEKYPNGGNVQSQYANKADALDNFLWSNYLGNGELGLGDFDQQQRDMFVQRNRILKDIPSSGSQINNPANENEVKYLNNLMGRMQPHITKENADMLMKSNWNPINVKNKIDFVKDLPLYKADMDSIQKYMPNFYEDNNLKMSKAFLKEGEVPEYAMGGMTEQMVPAELEGGESFETPQGEDFSVEGPTHAGGGVQMELPEGTRVFSDRIKVPGTKQTYSDANKKLTNKISKYNKTIEDPYATPIAKRSAQKMLDKLDGEQNDLFMSQERLKHTKNIKPSKMKYPGGGVVTQKDIEDAINLSFDNLRDSYKNNTKTGLDNFSTGDSVYNTSDLIENKRNNLLNRLRGDSALINSPERLQGLYNNMIANGIIQGDYAGNGSAPSNTSSLLESRYDPFAAEYTPGYGTDEDIKVDPASYGQALDNISGSNLASDDSFNGLGGTYPMTASKSDGTPVFNNPYTGIGSTYPMTSAASSGDNIYGTDATTATPRLATPTIADNSTTATPAVDNTLASTGTASFNPSMTDYSANLTAPLSYPGVGSDYTQYAAAPTSGSTPAIGVDEDSYSEALAGISGDNLDGVEDGNKFGNIASTVAAAAPALYNIGQGLFGKTEQLNPSDYYNKAGMQAATTLKNRRYNARPELDAARRATATGRRNIRSGARTRGELLSNYAGLSAQQGRQEAGILANKQNIENQYASEAANMLAGIGQQNAATDMQVGQYNARSRANQSNMLTTGMSQLSQLAQQRAQDKQAREMDDRRLALLPSLFPSYRYDKRTGRYTVS